MTLDRFEAMSALVSAGSYVDIEEPLREMRLIKTADEVARIKHAVKLVEDALDETVKK